MADIEESLEKVMSVEGAIAVALIDSKTGSVLGKIGDDFDFKAAGIGNTELIRSTQKTLRDLQLDDTTEDILITLGRHYHIIRPVACEPDLFLYLVLDKSHTNLAVARLLTANVESEMFI